MVGAVSREDHTRELIAKAKAGDRASFDELAAEWRVELETMIRFRLGERLRRVVEVEDVLQETYLKAYRSLKSFEPRGERSFCQWLKAIADHVMRSIARKRRQEALLCFDDDVPAREASPSSVERRKERFDRLEDALNSLSKDHREVIVL